MQTFKYTAFDSGGNRVTGVMEAEGPQAVRNALTAQRLTPANIEVDKGKASSGSLFSIGGKRKPKGKDIALFTKQLSVVLRSGVTLVDALRTIGEATPNQVLADALKDVVADISGGLGFADALARQGIFGNFLVEMVRAGEKTGQLDDVLSRVSVQMEKSNKLRAQIKKALTYPSVILSFSVIAIIAMMVFVVPQFMSIMDGMDVDMPMLTQIVVGVSDALKDNFLVIIGVAVAGFFAFSRWKSTESGAAQLDKILLRLPLVGRIMSTSALANFASSLSFSQSAGLDMMESLDITSRVVGLRPMERAVQAIRGRVREGIELSTALHEQRELFPTLIVGMVRVGEESGELEVTLSSVAEFFEQEVEEATAAMSAMIEPFMMIFLGGFVGGLVAALMMPMVSVMQGI